MKDNIPNFNPRPTKIVEPEERANMEAMRKKYLEEGGMIKDYGTNFELNDYKLKKDK
jgi:hypothetical protein